MEDFATDIENALQTLAAEEIVFFPAAFGFILAVDATQANAVHQLQKLADANNFTSIILMSDERQLMQHATTIDLEVFNFLDEQQLPTAILYNNIVELADEALSKTATAFILIDKSNFSKTLIKRFRKPLFAVWLNSRSTNFQSFAHYVVANNQQSENQFQALQFFSWVDNEAVALNIAHL